MATRNVAFFGATGGCANACLAKTLQNGHHAIALVRSEHKLREQLEARKVSRGTIDKQLTIIQGDVKNASAVRKVLEFNGKGVDTVISGIGGVATPQFSLIRPMTMTDPTICGDATEQILSAISQAQLPRQPLIVVISANGVRSDIPRDYPLMLTPLYRWLLTGVYDDKRRMEAALEKTRPQGGYVIVRPSALNNGESKGLKSIRQGTTKRPVLGYSINRDDVGLWMYESLINRNDRNAFENDGVSITY